MLRVRALVFIILFLVASAVTAFGMSVQRETFTDMPEGVPDPAEIMRGLRELLDRYDKPEMWGSVMSNARRTPAELARLHLQQTESHTST